MNHSCVLLAVLAGVSTQAHAQSICASQYRGDWFPTSFSAGAYGVGVVTASNAAGTRFAVGCPGFTQQSLETGAVCVVDVVGSGALQEGLVLPPVPIHMSMFGFRGLALNSTGDLLAVGAYGEQGNLGRAFVYRRVANGWNLDAELVGVGDDRFGFAVVLSGDGARMVVSAPFRDVGARQGAVLTYRREPSGWVFESMLSPNDLPLAGDLLGNVLAISENGEVLAIRSFASPSEPIPSGAVYMMRHTGIAWAFEARLQEPVAYTNCCFGQSLALDAHGETLVAGNYSDSRAGLASAGAVTVFRYGANGWAYETSFASPQPSHDGFFGWSVALNGAGDRLVVGAPIEVNGVTQSGAVHEFVAARGNWTDVAKHHARVPEFAASFGRSVAMNASGTKWLTGEWRSDSYGVNLGRVHLFEADCLDPTLYCRAQVNTLGCTPRIGAQGLPSASSPSGFLIAATNLRNQQNGMLLYGTNGRAALPWLGGTLCVKPPLRRTPVANSGGSPAPANNCSGVLAVDFNAWAWTAPDPDLFAGQHVRAQFYSRDPGAPANLNLTDAIEFYLEP
jgi:hypothetical protein